MARYMCREKANTNANPNVIIRNSKEANLIYGLFMYALAFFVTRDHICYGEFALTA